MYYLNIAQQTLVEKSLLECLVVGLHNAVTWRIKRDDLFHKLGKLKFIIRSFQSHMERMLALEERDGYMDSALERRPHLSRSAEALRHEHDEFREEIRLLVKLLEGVSPTDQNGVDSICDRTSRLLKKVDRHNKKETDILHEAIARDIGGEG
jgi:hemerythrin-like domain-containing protein